LHYFLIGFAFISPLDGGTDQANYNPQNWKDPLSPSLQTSSTSEQKSG